LIAFGLTGGGADSFYKDFQDRWIDSGALSLPLASTNPNPPFTISFVKLSKVIPNVWKCPVCKSGCTWVNSTGITLATYKPGEC